MNALLLAIVNIAKLVYPFIRESILGQESVLTLLRKRKAFMFLLVSNLALFFMLAFLTEQNFIFLDRLKEVKGQLKHQEEINAELTVKNSRLLGMLKGDLDEVCYAHLFKGKLDLVPEEVRAKLNNSSYIQPNDQANDSKESVDQNSSTEE